MTFSVKHRNFEKMKNVIKNELGDENEPVSIYAGNLCD